MNEEIMIDWGEIILREYRMEDVQALYEITLQPEVYQFSPGAQSLVEKDNIKINDKRFKTVANI